MANSYWIRLAVLCIVAALFLASPVSSRGAEEESAIDEAWTALEPLLRKREYGSAASLLETLADESLSAKESERLEDDRRVALGLQELATKVRKSIDELKPGASLKANGIDYAFVRRESDIRGLRLIATPVGSEDERELSVDDLSSGTWLDLTGGGVRPLENQPLIVAVFLGFDRDPDREAARRLFDKAAASKGADVSEWLVRLERAAEAKGRPRFDDAQEATPLIGEWSVSVGKRGSGKRFSAEFKNGGRVDIPDSRWERESAGRYRITFRDGPTAIVTVAGNVFWGQFGNGTKIYGIRKASR